MKQYVWSYLDWISKEKAWVADERVTVGSAKITSTSRIIGNESLSEHFEERNWNSHFIYKENGGK